MVMSEEYVTKEEANLYAVVWTLFISLIICFLFWQIHVYNNPDHVALDRLGLGNSEWTEKNCSTVCSVFFDGDVEGCEVQHLCACNLEVCEPCETQIKQEHCYKTYNCREKCEYILISKD